MITKSKIKIIKILELVDEFQYNKGDEVKINNKEIAKNEKGLLIPKTDVVFQALFGVKGSERILGGFLSKILNQEVKKVSLDANQNLVQETVDEKLGILDLRAIIEENIDVNIEIQLVDKANLEKRILLYWARRYGVQLKPGEDYRKLRKTIAILITDYEIPNLVWFKDAHTRWELLERRNPGIKVFEDIEVHIIEMPKIEANPKATEKGLKNWIKFLQNPESEAVKMSNDKELDEAYKKLENISGDEKLRRLSELRLKAILDEKATLECGREAGLKEGLKEGMAKGERAKQLEIAKNLIKLGINIDDIIKATGLSKEEIEKMSEDK